jgi:hypothetical protein
MTSNFNFKVVINQSEIGIANKNLATIHFVPFA